MAPPSSAPAGHGEPSARARGALLLAFCVLFAAQIVSMVQQRTPYFEDDAPFFFRYADNLAAGHGYRWNPEEPPVWGASAPFWPLFLSAFIRAGLAAEEAALIGSWVLALGATLLLGVLLQRVAGIWGVLALAPLLAINHLVTTWVTSGMESPLTAFVLAGAFLVTVAPVPGWAIGLAAGACMVHKLDLAPVGVVLLAGCALWKRDRLAPAVGVALLMAGLWYGFAAWYFGHPLPSSFMRKLTADYGDVDRWWFALRALKTGAWWMRLPPAALGLFYLARRWPFLAVVATASVAIPIAGYTLKPPPETFTWYTCAPAVGIAVLAALGLAWVLQAVAGPPGGRGYRWRAALSLAVLPAVAWLLVPTEYKHVRGWQRYLGYVESQRVAAGTWVDRHAPADAKVLTSWGNVAYYARRFVYDQSFLNRKPEAVDLRTEYQPEVIVDCLAFTGHPHEEYRPPRGYRIVRKITESVDSGRIDFYAIVMFRHGVEVVGLDAPAGAEAESSGG